VTVLLERIFGPRDWELTEPVRLHKSLKKRLNLNRKIEDADFVAFDTELTGLNFKQDSIISIGAVKLKGGRILPGKTFYRLVKPESELNHKSVVIHELTHTDLLAADTAKDVLADFIDFIGDAILIGHFVFIDINFVDRAMKKMFGMHLQNPAVDTLGIHDWLNENDSVFARHFGGMTLKNDLFSMATRYGIEVEKSHNAFHDAYLTAQLFQRFLHFLPGCGIKTVDELLSVGKT
jgi:DNA polymerase-3 subunit epsilon